MARPRSEQSRFLLRASLSLAVLLVVWWFALRPPLLAWTRISTDVILNAIPGAPLQTGVTSGSGVWVLQAPVRSQGVWRNVRLETVERLPTQLTIAVPLFWAILLAAPRVPRRPLTWIGGTLLLLAIPPAGLLLYAAHVVQMYVYPGAPAIGRAVLSGADYFASAVLPYVGPVLLALALDGELRKSVIGGPVSG
jgi:hypothetical protein